MSSDSTQVHFGRPNDLERIRKEALVQVDTEAEQGRLRYLTSGTGQALEYQASEADARAFIANGGDLTNYPFLKAEIDALGDSDPVAVATTVIAQADAWRMAGSEIKRLRREAKLKINAATTPAEIYDAKTISWPTP